MALPRNIVDAAMAIKDGNIGLIKEIKIGDTIVSALYGLNDPVELVPTRKPIQSGYTLTDAVAFQPRELSLDIVLANPDYSAEAGLEALLSGSVTSFTESWRDKKDQLYAAFHEAEIVTVQTHHELVDDMIITSISPIHNVDENWDAFFCTVNLSEIRTAEATSTGGVVDGALEHVGTL